MFTEFFGFKENPFGLTADFSFFCLDATKMKISQHILDDLNKGSDLVIIVGSLGVGKTQFLRYLNTRLPSNIQNILLSGSSVSSPEQVRFIIQRTHESFELGKKLVVIIDDAHKIPDDGLNLLLSLIYQANQDVPPCQILFSGLDKIEFQLARIVGKQGLENFRRYELMSLNHEQVADYVSFRLKRAGYNKQDIIFPANVIQLIADLSQGIPHYINLLCGASLLMASLDGQQQVTEEIVREASLSCLLSPAKSTEAVKRKPISKIELNKSRGILIGKRRQAFPFSTRIGKSKYALMSLLARQSINLDALLKDTSDSHNKPVSNTLLQKKFELEVQLGIGICLVGLASIFMVKMFSSSEDSPHNPEKSTTTHQTQISDKKSTLPPAPAVIDQRLLPDALASDQLEDKSNIEIASAPEIQAGQKRQLSRQASASKQEFSDAKKISEKKRKQSEHTNRHGENQSENLLRLSTKVESDSSNFHQANLAHHSRSASEVSQSQNNQIVDEQEASVRERSVNRLKLDKLGIEFGVDSLLKSSQKGDVQSVKLILGGGIPSDVKDALGDSALLTAAKHRQLQVVQALLEKGASSDIKNNLGQTPLMMAVQNGDKKIVMALLKSGANPYIKDLRGLTASSYASQDKFPDILHLLASR
jgi:type II secretory pathway predicted ATPase ExeA